MEIIDFHAHIYPEKIAVNAIKGIRDFYSIKIDRSGTAEDLIKNGEENGVSRFLVQSVATVPHQVKSINRFIADECERHKNFIGFGTLHPDLENPQEDIEEILSLGLHGVKLHPDTQHFNIDDPKMFPIYDMLQGRLPVLMHCGDYRYTYSHPKRMKRVLENFPKLTVVAAHFGGWSLWDLALEYLLDMNCYVDTSSSIMFLGQKRAKELIRLYGSDRVVFGTDYPMWTAKDSIEEIMSLGLRDDELEKIFSGNAKRIIGGADGASTAE